jgi:hypothetical protein
MTIFNPAHFLRHISMPTLREFTDAHPLGQSQAIDWSLAQELLDKQKQRIKRLDLAEHDHARMLLLLLEQRMANQLMAIQARF